MSSGSTTWQYTYDANGMRTKRTNGSTSYEYFYTGDQLTMMTRAGTQFWFYYDASGTPYALNYNGTYYYYATNLQGDVVAILNTSGTAVVQYTYDAWGDIRTTTGTMSSTLGQYNPLRYRGYVYDQETGLYYLLSRYYDPELGRFINADAFISTGQGLLGNNMFAYCGNNPVIRYDPTGNVWDFSFDIDLEWLYTGAQKGLEILEAGWECIEASAGFGLGMFAGFNLFDDFLGAELGTYYDVFNISLSGGEFSVQEKFYVGADLSAAFYSISFEEEKHREYSQYPSEWIVDEPEDSNDTFEIWGSSAYFFAGANISVGFNSSKFFNRLDEILFD